MNAITVIVLCCVVNGKLSNAQEHPWTCTAGNFKIGSQGSITCNFGRDICAEKRPFSIIHVSEGDGKSKPEETPVLMCQWVDEKPKCMVESERGYKYDNGVSMSENKACVTLKIDNVTAKHAGNYSCQISETSHQTQSDMCTLQIEKENDSGVPSDPTNAQPTYVNTPPEASSVDIATLVIVVFIFIGFVLYVLYPKCRRFYKKKFGSKKNKLLMDDTKRTSISDEDKDEKENQVTRTNSATTDT